MTFVTNSLNVKACLTDIGVYIRVFYLFSLFKLLLFTLYNCCFKGERPFKCDYCTSTFNQKEALMIHLQRHTGAKPHSCQYCNAKFTQKGNLKIHIKVILND